MFHALAFLISCSFANTLSVLIDPGHGGSDSGAVHGDAREAEIALKVGAFLHELLEKDPQFKSRMTRTGDQPLSLEERVAKIDKETDVFVSIHANASTDRRVRGFEIYFQNHLPPDEDALFLAAQENKLAQVENKTEDTAKSSDVASILDDLKRQNRIVNSFSLSKSLYSHWEPQKKDPNAIKQAPFHVVSKPAVPAVLVELGYVTNSNDAEKLVNNEYQKTLASRIHQGLRAFKEKMDKTLPQSLQ
jgi:N-acetylmuramoyl-L-alanine amidase